MDQKIINNLNIIESEIESKKKKVNIIAVSKTFPINMIIPLINNGHVHYGENKVQEAVEKWSSLKSDFKQIKLHLIGKLQTNKVKFILPLFDFIHSLDSMKLAEKISLEQKKKNFKPKIFVQVNIGNEIQKSGIPVNELDAFYNYCRNEINLKILGLMIIPPMDQNVDKYFKSLNELSKSLALEDTSMGMSADYLEAIKHGSTFVRIGSSIFGSRS